MDGMTDLQYKAFLKSIIRELKYAVAKEDKEATDKMLNELIKDFQGTVNS